MPCCSRGLADDRAYKENTPQVKSVLSEYPLYMITEPLFQLWFLSDVMYNQIAFEDIIKRAKKYYYKNKVLKSEFHD